MPLAQLRRPLAQFRLTFVGTAGVQPAGTLAFDVVHPLGDYTFRRLPSSATPDDLEIHQLKYPTDGAHGDLNVIFPIERLQELAREGVVSGLTENFFSIGDDMEPDLLERTLAEDLGQAVVDEQADLALLSPA